MKQFFRPCDDCTEVGVTGACREVECRHWKEWWGGGDPLVEKNNEVPRKSLVFRKNPYPCNLAIAG